MHRPNPIMLAQGVSHHGTTNNPCYPPPLPDDHFTTPHPKMPRTKTTVRWSRIQREVHPHHTTPQNPHRNQVTQMARSAAKKQSKAAKGKARASKKAQKGPEEEEEDGQVPQGTPTKGKRGREVPGTPQKYETHC